MIKINVNNQISELKYMVRKIFEYLKSNLWLIPTAIVLGAIGSALLLLFVDSVYDTSAVQRRWPWIFAAGPDGSREMLSAVASSVITVAGVAFSITIVVLSMASSQYSPRALRAFMGDWRSQIVLGGFLGIFAYCLVVLRTVQSTEHSEFVPVIAVFGSELLAMIAVGLLIYFLHHVAVSIRASDIIHNIYSETVGAIEAILQDADFRHVPSTSIARETCWWPIVTLKSGYVQSMNHESMTKLAYENGLTIEFQKGVGDFVIEGSTFALASTSLSRKNLDRFRRLIDIGKVRNLEQDFGFGIRQLVDVALKGLSPGINDTTTAIIATNYIGALLARLCGKSLTAAKCDVDGKTYVTLVPLTFCGFLDLGFDQIRQSGARNPNVLFTLVALCEVLMDRARDTSQRDAIKTHLLRVVQVLRDAHPAHDYDSILNQAMKALRRFDLPEALTSRAEMLS